MKSAHWGPLVNGQARDVCGSHSGWAALWFSGPDIRRVDTVPLDMRHGGYVQFRMKHAPGEWGGGTEKCKFSSGADVELQASVDGGANFERIEQFNSIFYRTIGFNEISVEVPEWAWSNTTIFRWAQPIFLYDSDHWAIDDVRIFHTFAPRWRKTYPFDSHVKRDAHEDVEFAQCCYKTDGCELYPDPLELDSVGFPGGCGDVMGYRAHEHAARGRFLLDGERLYLLIAAAIVVYNWGYRFFRAYCLIGLRVCVPRCCRKKRKKVYARDDPPSGTLEKQFNIVCDTQWQRRWIAATAVPLGLLGFWNFTQLEWQLRTYLPLEALGEGYTLKLSNVFFWAVATYLDCKAWFTVAKEVVCIIRPWVPLCEIDSRLSANCINLGSKKIGLNDISDVQHVTKQYTRRIGVAYVVAVWPYANLLLLLARLNAWFELSRAFAMLLAAVLCARTFAGPNFIVSAGFSLSWLFATEPEDRNAMGASLLKPRVRWGAYYIALATGSAIAIPLALSKHYGLLSSPEVLALEAIVYLSAAAYGAMLGCSQGLPIAPHFVMTMVDEGMLITFDERVRCPCLRHCYECTAMHSRLRMLLVFTDDPIMFLGVLKGENNN